MTLHIVNVLFATVPIAVILLGSEYLWRKEYLKGERARKFIHILAGAWIAFWPYYVPFDGILILGCMALSLLIYSRVTRLFHAIYAVERTTYGELFYALAIIGSALYAQEAWIFTVAILLLAVADGGAAVVGRFWGLKNQYLVFGSKNLLKSVSGTVAYFLLSYICIVVGLVIGDVSITAQSAVWLFVVLPISSTLIENITPYGLDNLAIPVITIIVLTSLI